MYLPSHFEVTDDDALRSLMSEHPLGILVTFDGDGLHADHIPFLMESGIGEYGRLIGHVARNNEAWRRIDGHVKSLVIFQGPSAYISPNWYQSKPDTHRVVPTYNYAVVHVYGQLMVHDDSKWTRGVVGKLTKKMEAVMATPWKMADAPTEYLEQQIDNIVGIEIRISRMIGKWKVSQNRIEADRLGAIQGLQVGGRPEQLAMAGMIDRAMRTGD